MNNKSRFCQATCCVSVSLLSVSFPSEWLIVSFSLCCRLSYNINSRRSVYAKVIFHLHDAFQCTSYIVESGNILFWLSKNLRIETNIFSVSCIFSVNVSSHCRLPLMFSLRIVGFGVSLTQFLRIVIHTTNVIDNKP